MVSIAAKRMENHHKKKKKFFRAMTEKLKEPRPNNLRSGVPIFSRLEELKERLIQLLDYSSAAP